jgi:spermidine/putrescine transport system permease protein
MTTTTAPMPSLNHRASRWFSRNLIRIYAALAFIYLFIPVAYTFAFSFNDAGKSNLVWQGFTLDNWKNPCGAPQVCQAVSNSLQIGIISTVIATVLGTMIAFALGRHKFRGRTSTNLLIFLPMATPEVVLGASLTVKARIASLDPRLEQAAMDLYANERDTFRFVTLPLVMPGIAGAALLAFSLSFDDFIITNFNSGVESTFPKFVYVSAARGIPAQANVIGSAMFFIALIIVIVGQVVSRQRKKS